VKIISFSNVDGLPYVSSQKLEKHVSPAVSHHNRTNLVNLKRILRSAKAPALDNLGVQLGIHCLNAITVRLGEYPQEHASSGGRYCGRLSATGLAILHSDRASEVRTVAIISGLLQVV